MNDKTKEPNRHSSIMPTTTRQRIVKTRHSDFPFSGKTEHCQNYVFTAQVLMITTLNLACFHQLLTNCYKTQTWRAIATAVFLLSPVSKITSMPMFLSVCTASAASVFTVSAMASTPSRLSSTAARIAV